MKRLFPITTDDGSLVFLPFNEEAVKTAMQQTLAAAKERGRAVISYDEFQQQLIADEDALWIADLHEKAGAHVLSLRMRMEGN